MSLSITSWKQAAVVAPCAVALAAVASTAPDDAVSIRHEPLSCVTLDRYARLSASAAPAERVAGAELQFRDNAGTGWYGVRMVLDGDGWAALLPKPTPPTRRFEYRIVMTDRDSGVHETAPVTVTVADAAGCAAGAGSSVAVSAPIVVRVPAGAPVMPPVPAGFSPAGVVAAATPQKKSWTKALIGGGAALAGGVVVATAGGDSQPAGADAPRFAFSSVTPGVGSLLTPQTSLSISVLVTTQPRSTVTFEWRFAIPSSDNSCLLSMERTAVFSSSRPGVSTVPVQLSGPLVLSGTCGSTIEFPSARFMVSIDGATKHDETIAVNFTYVR
jgi:hypothetical protein